jgi:predicted amidophosphoribosyltransferase
LRKWKRWYNSSEVLCKYFAKLSKINYKKKIITKTKNVKQQSKLNKQERLVNLKWVFQINEKEIDKFKNKNIIIIDDVVSTWTTINEVAKVLKKYWAKEIIWLVIASGQ